VADLRGYSTNTRATVEIADAQTGQVEEDALIAAG
jgi:hypothetical protein